MTPCPFHPNCACERRCAAFGYPELRTIAIRAGVAAIVVVTTCAWIMGVLLP